MVAMVGVVLVIDRYSGGLVRFYFSFLLPLPMILYAAKYGFKAALVPLCAILILTFIIGLPTTLFIVANTCVSGLVYGWGVYAKKKNGFLLLSTIGFTTMMYFVTTYLWAGAFGISISEEIALAVQIFEGMQVQLPSGADLASFVYSIYPLVLLMSATLEGFLIHLIAHLILKRLKYEVNEPKNVFDLKAPKWLGYVLLLLCLSPVVVNYLNLHEKYTDICYTVSALGIMVLMLYGLVTVIWLIRIFGKRSYIFLFYALMFLFPLVVYRIVAFVGAIDMVVDLRNVIRERKNDVK